MSTILIGVDSTARSEDAVALAGRLARAGTGDVVVASVTAANGPARDQAQLAARRMSLLLAGVEAERVRVRVVASASPARGLHESAEAESAAVTVVGSTHTGHLGRVRPGSTGERLLCGSPSAVAVVPHGYRTRRDQPIARVGAAYDGSPEAREALAAAFNAASAFGARLDVISVVPTDFYGAPELISGAGYDTIHDEIEAKIRRDLDETVAGLDMTEAVMLEGRPWRELADHSAKLDLLFVGSRGYGPLHAVIAGATSGALVNHAHCPVIVLPRGSQASLADLFDRSAATTA